MTRRWLVFLLAAGFLVTAEPTTDKDQTTSLEEKASFEAAFQGSYQWGIF